jgi:modification methylase
MTPTTRRPDRATTSPTAPRGTRPRPRTDPASTASDKGPAAERAGEMSVPRSVWLTGQQTSRSQRTGRYLPGSTAHPGKMLPAIARHAITTYTNPGDLVLDPMCGIGTTLLEAVHLGRHAAGVEYEARWAALARANLEHAATSGATGSGTVATGDGRSAPALLPEVGEGTVALLLTSPPYGASLHGQVTPHAGTDGKVGKHDYRYSTDPNNLAHTSTTQLLAAFTQILTACRPLLRPGGHVAITARPWREHGQLIDLPAAVLACGAAAGLIPVGRHAALLAAVRDGQLVPRASFFQLGQVRAARGRGLPLAVIAHEDVLIFRNPGRYADPPAGKRSLEVAGGTR